MTRLALLLTLFFSLFFFLLVALTGFLNQLNPRLVLENAILAFFLFGCLGFAFGFIADVYLLGRGAFLASLADATRALGFGSWRRIL